MIWHDPDKFFFDDSDVPDTNDGEMVTNQNRLTNADLIRSLSDKELAKWLAKTEWDAYEHPRAMTEYSMRIAWLDWLKSPAEPDGASP